MFKKFVILVVAFFTVAVSTGTGFALDNFISAYIHDGDETFNFSTYAKTVGELLTEAGVQLGVYDIVTPGQDHVFENLAEHHISITRGFTVTVQMGFSSEEIEVPNGMRVGFLLQRIREERGVEYIYNGSLNEELRPGQLLQLDVASTEHVVEYELLPYDTIQVMSDDILEGRLEIINEGREGIREIVYSVVSVNGFEQSRQLISDTVSFRPESRVIHIGTGKLPLEEQQFEEAANNFNNGENAENNGYEQPVEATPVEVIEIAEIVEEVEVIEQVVEEIVEPVVEEVVEEFDPDAPPKHYAQILKMHATAYTSDYASTGKNPGHPLFGVTASGMKAKYGVVAVDPNVIPLGSELYIYGYGYCIAADTGGAIKGNRIDLYFNTAEECYRFGHRDIEVYILQ